MATDGQRTWVAWTQANNFYVGYFDSPRGQISAGGVLTGAVTRWALMFPSGSKQSQLMRLTERFAFDSGAVVHFQTNSFLEMLGKIKEVSTKLLLEAICRDEL